jgi:GntR family transcriptional regulator
MYVMMGATEKLAQDEKRLFLMEEWPRLVGKIARLGLSVEELLEEGSVK